MRPLLCALALLAPFAGCADRAAPTSAAETVARDVADDYAASLAADRLTDACAQAGVVAASYREAGDSALAARWQATEDSTCAALDARAEALGDAIADTLGE